MGRTKAPSFLDRLIGYDGPQPLTDEATAELRAEGVRNADRIPGGRIDAKMVRDPSLVDRLTGYDGPQPLTPEGEKAFAAMHEAENAPVRIQPIDLGYMPEDETQVTPDWGMDLTDVKAPRQPRVSVRHATADTSDMVQRMSDRLQALVDPSSQTTQQQTATADAGEVRPGSMKGFFQNAITGTGTPTDARKPLVPPEVAAFVAKQTGTTLPTPDADAMAEAKRRAGLGDTLASLTDQLEIANGKFDAGRSARLHANAQQPVTDEKAKQDQVRAFVEKKLGLERQARQDQRQAEIDALNKKNTESEMAMRESQRAQIGKPKPMDPLEEEKTRAEIAKLNAEAAKLGRHGNGLTPAQQERENAYVQRDIASLAKSLDGAPALKNDLATLVDAANKDDIPGVSKAYGMVPGFAESWFAGDDGLKVRQAARGVVGNYLKMRSGTAASDAEVDRTMRELGLGPNASEKEFRTGLSRLIKNFRDEVTLKGKGVRPEALKEARDRGMLMPDDFPNYDPSKDSSAPNVPKAATAEDLNALFRS